MPQYFRGIITPASLFWFYPHSSQNGYKNGYSLAGILTAREV